MTSASWRPAESRPAVAEEYAGGAAALAVGDLVGRLGMTARMPRGRR